MRGGGPGSTVRAAATAIGSQKFWGLPLTFAQRADAHWAAYDDEGAVVASGSIRTG